MTTLDDYKTYAIHRTVGLCLSSKVVNSDLKPCPPSHDGGKQVKDYKIEWFLIGT
jgi:hypothetical protein